MRQESEKNRSTNPNNRNEVIERAGTSNASHIRPELLAGYLQLTFNAAMLLMILIFMTRFLFMVQSDVNNKSRERLADDIVRIQSCKNEYEQNQCLPGTRVPALESLCNEWFKCMNPNTNGLQDRNIYQSGTLWAQTLAEIINAFVDRISIRSVIIILVTVCAIVMVTNVAFGSYRVYCYNSTNSHPNDCSHRIE